MMNKKVFDKMNQDRKLMVLFSGILVDGILLISLLIAASIWYLI